MATLENSTQQIELSITGMSCGGCARSVENALKTSAGVVNVSVNLPAQKATVSVVSGKVQRADLVKAVEEAGYGVVEA